MKKKPHGQKKGSNIMATISLATPLSDFSRMGKQPKNSIKNRPFIIKSCSHFYDKNYVTLRMTQLKISIFFKNSKRTPFLGFQFQPWTFSRVSEGVFGSPRWNSLPPACKAVEGSDSLLTNSWVSYQSIKKPRNIHGNARTFGGGGVEVTSYK